MIDDSLTGYAFQSPVAPGCRSSSGNSIKVRERHYAPWVGEKAPVRTSSSKRVAKSNSGQDQGKI